MNLRAFSTRTFNDSKQQRINLRKLRILKTIFIKEAVSVNELMRNLNISFPTLNNIIQELVEESYIVQNERGESVGGRKPNLYQLNNNILKVLCVEVNRFSIKISYIDNNNNTLFPSLTSSIDLSRGLEGLPGFVDTINNYIQQYDIVWDDVAGISIAMPGLIEFAQGKNYSFYFEKGFDLQNHLQEYFKKQVYIINDVKINTYAEQQFGALYNVRNGLSILMDWGMALGIITNGEIYMGKNGFSGEMGHMNFVEDGELCYCGKRGCLETVASGIALVKRAQTDIENNIPSLISRKFNTEAIEPLEIIEAALEGDQYAIELITDLGKKLGKAIALFVQIFNPERVVLSGKFAKAATLITNPIQQQIQTYAMGRILNNCEVVISSLSDSQITYSLARNFIVHYFDNSLLKEA